MTDLADVLQRIERCEIDQQELRSLRLAVNEKQSTLETQQITIDRLRNAGDLRTIDGIVSRIMELTSENAALRHNIWALKRRLRDARQRKRRVR